ncbi:MAG: hypothetical protein KDC38_19570, partial [Planctomycetes bacterium]|nr:hypothetical protein [Planctomycetota bacterium]
IVAPNERTRHGGASRTIARCTGSIELTDRSDRVAAGVENEQRGPMERMDVVFRRKSRRRRVLETDGSRNAERRCDECRSA